jgi:hypothetical protein
MHRPQVITPTKLNRACPPQRLPYLHPDLRLYNVQWQRRCETLDRVADVGTDAAKEQLAKLQAQQERPLPPPQACLRHQHGCKQLLSHPYPTGQLYDITTGQPTRKQLIIHPPAAHQCPCRHTTYIQGKESSPCDAFPVPKQARWTYPPQRSGQKELVSTRPAAEARMCWTQSQRSNCTPDTCM